MATCRTSGVAHLALAAEILTDATRPGVPALRMALTAFEE